MLGSSLREISQHCRLVHSDPTDNACMGSAAASPSLLDSTANCSGLGKVELRQAGGHQLLMEHGLVDSSPRRRCSHRLTRTPLGLQL